jgi:co-chaperonin GroES (HSP10)
MTTARKFLRPVAGFVLLVDDQPETTEGGIVVVDRVGTYHHDFYVAAVGAGGHDFGVGDRVVVRDPNAGRRTMLDGIAYKLVREADVIGVVE